MLALFDSCKQRDAMIPLFTKSYCVAYNIVFDCFYCFFSSLELKAHR